MFNNKGTRMDPCGTLDKVLSEALYGTFAFVLCFLLNFLKCLTFLEEKNVRGH